MNENIETKPVYLKPFKHFCMTVGELPTAYVETMSYYEMIIWFTKYLGEKVIPAIDNNAVALKEVQDLFLELQNYVNTYFDNIDLQEEINNKLDAMVEDGTLAEIINQEIFDELNEKINLAMLKTDNQSYSTLSLNRLFRKFIQNVYHPDHISGQDQPNMQGGTYTGNDKMVYIRINQDNNCVMEEISLIDGTIIRSASPNLGHGNSVTFNPETNKLYVTGLTGDDNHKVFVINYTSFTLENTLLFDDLDEDENVHSISYDIETEKMYLMTETSPTNYLKFYEINMSDFSLTEIELPDYENLLSITNTNDMVVYNDIIYIMKFNPQVILTYNIVSKEFQNLYNVENVSSAKIGVGDLENLSIMYDKDYKDLLIGTSKIECENGFYNMFQFFTANPVYNVSNNIALNMYGENQNIYVDINSTAINPDGTQSNKFKHLSEAFEYANNLNGNNDMGVANGEYPFVKLIDFKKVITLQPTDEIPNVIIDGLHLINCNNIYFTGMKFDNKSSSIEHDVVILRSYVKMSNCTMLKDSGATVKIHNSRFNTWNNTNLVLHSQAENVIETSETTPTFKIVSGNMPVLSKPVKLFNGTATSSSGSTTYDLTGNDVLKNCNNLLVSLHGNYNYINVSLPNITSNGDRLFACNLGEWLITIKLTRSGNTYAVSIFSCKEINSSITDVTSTASTDFIVYAQD